MKKCCFVPVDDKRFYKTGTPIMINSFRRFHPDIDLIVFRQDTVDKLFAKKSIDWYMATPYFAELLMNDYDLVVKMDADHIVLDRMTEVFDNVDYEVGFPWNFNDYENASFENITEEMYLQAGMVASTSKKFWLKWQERNIDNRKYLRRENDIVNLLVYNEMDELELKIFDKDEDYYGCKSLGRESEFYIEEGKTMCRKEQVIAYHYARGGVFPKLDIDTMPLGDDVKKAWKQIAAYGQTIKIVRI